MKSQVITVVLKPLEVYKHLPKKNCGECGFQTCLAFAMAIAGQKTEITLCPYLSQEAMEILSSASAPPIKSVMIGSVKIGDEKFMFRHEKKFYNETAFAVRIVDSLSPDDIEKILKKIRDLTVIRVGEELKFNLVCLEEKSGDITKFKQAVKLCSDFDFSLILISENLRILESSLSILSGKRPAIGFADEKNYKEISELAKKYNASLIVRAEDPEKLASLTEKIDMKEIILSFEERSPKQILENLTIIRRAAIKKKIRSLGYPTIIFLNNSDPTQNTLEATIYLAKYASVIVFPDIEKEDALALLILRQNIYTDPQKPLQMEPKIYEIGDPDENSPVLLTTNFSLTYFTVSGDIEASGIPCYLIVLDTEGLSVLTAYAAGKLDADKITKFLKNSEIRDMVKHRNIIIPGLISKISGTLEEKSGWNVIVGPNDSKDLREFLKNLKM
ncbi:MAG: acetyl-CoA decarbonylase/synthase complex subunit gamma [Deltaproteobacteria bacterium]|nr:MAG: acetyl-CoA decarbonylase/synthase complex subunit gamma [Deltaproteobacteria bacterium]